MIKFLLPIFISFSILQTAFTQELNCVVNIEFAKTQTTDARIFENLEAAISEFMNSRKWTDDNYAPYEKIDVSILINIDQEISANEFAGQFIIQSERPVYNSTYKTSVYSYKDSKFQFEFNEFGIVEYSDNNFLSNLTSFLAFYAYVVIGYDYDSFSPEGGTKYFLKAQDVINAIPSSARARYDGWSNFGDQRSRASLINDLLNPRYQAYRQIVYNFHREGLDKMYEDPEKARGVITKNLEALGSINDDNPNTLLLVVFFIAKNAEIVSIYSNASNAEKKNIVDLMTDMDPVNANIYREIK